MNGDHVFITAGMATHKMPLHIGRYLLFAGRTHYLRFDIMGRKKINISNYLGHKCFMWMNEGDSHYGTVTGYKVQVTGNTKYRCRFPDAGCRGIQNTGYKVSRYRLQG